MGYYQVLKGAYFRDFNPEAYYSYYNWWFSHNILGFKVYLRDINSNKLFLLTIKNYKLNRFDWEKKDKQSTFGYIKLQETDKDALISMKRYFIPKGDDIIFILGSNGSCGDINNHLFSVNKYGKADSYQYKGWRVIHEEQWIKTYK
jgi:hypothetical protein